LINEIVIEDFRLNDRASWRGFCPRSGFRFHDTTAHRRKAAQGQSIAAVSAMHGPSAGPRANRVYR